MGKEKFVLIYFKEEPKGNISNVIIDFLKGIIGNYIEPILEKNVLFFFYKSDKEFMFKEIINVLSNDFFVSMSLYESGFLYSKLDKNEYLNYIKNISPKFLECSTFYVNEDKLIKLGLGNEIVKMNILKKYYNDYEMLSVIKTYLDSNMNISHASILLYMHRNTVMKKIDKFISETGYDIRILQKAFVIFNIL